MTIKFRPTLLPWWWLVSPGHPRFGTPAALAVAGILPQLSFPCQDNRCAVWILHCFQVELVFRDVGFCGGRKTGKYRKKSTEQGREPTTNVLNDTRRQLIDLNPDHIGGRLRLPCSPIHDWWWFYLCLKVLGEANSGTEVSTLYLESELAWFCP